MPQVTNKIAILKDHKERVTDAVFSPVDDCLATASSADRTAKLWKTDGTLLQTFEGHLDRLARVAFHPSGTYLGTTSFDNVGYKHRSAELLLQEGHSRSVYGIAFQQDGALAASSGLDSLARVWDLRAGRSILVFQGHIKPVLSVNFSPNGYHLASGGEDNQCRIWDLRMRKSLYIIPAHAKPCVSEIWSAPLLKAYQDTSQKLRLSISPQIARVSQLYHMTAPSSSGQAVEIVKMKLKGKKRWT